MKYSIEFLPRYRTTIPGKYERWSNLNQQSLGYSQAIRIVNCNYQVYYK